VLVLPELMDSYDTKREEEKQEPG